MATEPKRYAPFKAHRVPNDLRKRSSRMRVEQVEYQGKEESPCGNPGCIAVLQEGDLAWEVEAPKFWPDQTSGKLFCSLVCKDEGIRGAPLDDEEVRELEE